MWTIVGVVIGIAVILAGAIWYVRRAESNDIELEVARIRADEERARRVREEEEAVKLSAKRMEEFNEKAAAARGSASRAAELLNESARSASD